MPNMTFPPLTSAPRWKADGEWYTGAVEIADEHGVVAVLEGRVSKAAVLALTDNLRAQLAHQAPATVDVGAWVELMGKPQQDLHRWAMEQELQKSILEKVDRRGWVHRPPWFGEWDGDVLARAYRLIIGAQAGDQVARSQLDSLRSGAMAGEPRCREALAKFNSLGRLIARGMSLDVIFAAAELGEPDADEWVVEAGAVARGSSRAASRPAARSTSRAAPARATSRAVPTRSSRAASTARLPSRPTVAARPAVMAARPTVKAQPIGRITPLRVPASALQPLAVPYATPAVQQAPYGYAPQGYPPGGGSGGGDGGPDDDFPLDDGQGGAEDYDDLNDPIPPPEGGKGEPDEFADEPPPDDGSGHTPFARAPGEGGGAEAGGAAPDGQQETAAQAGGGVEMVPDMGDDQYPDEGAAMGSLG